MSKETINRPVVLSTLDGSKSVALCRDPCGHMWLVGKDDGEVVAMTRTLFDILYEPSPIYLDGEQVIPRAGSLSLCAEAPRMMRVELLTDPIGRVTPSGAPNT